MTLAELNDKNADIESIAGRALKDEGLLSELVDGLKAKAETYRYNCSKALHSISRTHGEVLYRYWDTFTAALSSDNSYHKMSAVHLIADLITADKENRFGKIFDTYYGLLDDKSMIVAYYVANVSGRIAKARPALQKAITARLLGIDKTSHKTSRKELIKAGMIEAFEEYYDEYDNKAEILDFVKRSMNSESSKTRKTAKAFLAKRDTDK